MSMHLEKPQSMTRRSIAHDIAAVTIMGFYGGRVCPFVEELDLVTWFLELTFIFAIAFGIRQTIAERFISSLPATRKVAGQFWLELGIFLFIGLIVAAYNLLLHGFPIESGYKMMFGAAALGFFKGMDMSLARERVLAAQFTTEAFELEPGRDFYPITRKFAVFATLTAIIVTTVILLVLSKDLNWMLETSGLAPAEMKLAVLKEIVFIAMVFLVYIINLIMSYSHNLKRLVDEENQALVAVSQGDFSHSVKVYTNDEFGIMGRYTNQMIRDLNESRYQLQQAHHELVESERLRAIGEFASTIVHEVRSPLNVVQMMLDFFDKQELAEGGRKRLVLARTEVTRLTSLMNEILLYAKPHRLEQTELDLAQTLSDWMDIFETLPAARGRRIELRLSCKSVRIEVDADRIKQAMLNLVANACEAAPEGEPVQIHLDSGESGARIEVHNGGAPIPSDQLQHLTEPFFTTKHDGTGLGLAIVKRIMETHGGRLNINSSETEGTRVMLSFPAQSGATGSVADGKIDAPPSISQ